MGIGSTLLDAASVNSAVMSRGTAFSCTSTRRGGTRTSLFGSIAQRFKALQSAAGSSHGIDGKIKENQPVVFEVMNAERGFGGGGVGGKRWASRWPGNWGALTCTRYRPELK